MLLLCRRDKAGKYFRPQFNKIIKRGTFIREYQFDNINGVRGVVSAFLSHIRSQLLLKGGADDDEDDDAVDVARYCWELDHGKMVN